MAGLSNGSIRELLDPRVLSRAYNQIAPEEVDDMVFIDQFYVNVQEFDDHKFRGLYRPEDLYAAPTNEIGAEAQIITVGEATERHYTMVNQFNKHPFSGDVLTALREEGSYSIQKKGRTEIGHTVRQYSKRNMRTKNLWISKALTGGIVYVDVQGRILEASSGAVKTVDFEPVSAQAGTCGGLLSTGSFATDSTNIPSILDNILGTNADNANPTLTDIWVNRKNLNYIINNDYFQNWAQYSGEYAKLVLQQLRTRGSLTLTIPNLWGYNWHFVAASYKDYAGTSRAYIPATGAGSMIMTPPPGGDWQIAAKGKTLIPRSLGVVGSSIDDILNEVEEVYGGYSYAMLNNDPLKLWLYYGDLWGYNFENPAAIWRPQAF